MTDRIAEIEERMSKATPGQWQIDHGGMPQDSGFSISSKGEGEHPWHLVCERWPCSELDYRPADAQFIANARDDIAYLLAALKSKNAECERLRTLVKDLKDRAYFPTAHGYETIEDTLCNLDADPTDYSPEIIDLQSRVLAELEGK